MEGERVGGSEDGRRVRIEEGGGEERDGWRRGIRSGLEGGRREVGGR